MQATFEYHKLLEKILEYGKPKSDRTGTGTITIPNYSIELDVSKEFPMVTTKKLHFKSIVHELLWFLSGDTNTKYLNENGVTIWDEWANANGDLGPVYGKQWVNWENTHIPSYIETNDAGYARSYYPTDIERKSINQIQNALDKLRNNPEDRGNIVSAWNVGELDKMALRPCHWAFQLITEELTHDERFKLYKDANVGGRVLQDNISGINFKQFHFDEANIPKYRLHLKWHQRSVDTFLGLPFNISSYALLLHMFAQQSNMVVGNLYGDLSEVHIYDNHMDYVKEQLERSPYKYNAPTVTLNKAESIFDYKFEDFTLNGYEAFPNWTGKNKPPIAV